MWTLVCYTQSSFWGLELGTWMRRLVFEEPPLSLLCQSRKQDSHLHVEQFSSLLELNRGEQPVGIYSHLPDGITENAPCARMHARWHTL